MASVKEMRIRIACGEIHAEDHEGDADGGGGEAAPRPERRRRSARPYAQRMAAVIANLAAGVSGDGAPLLLAGTGRDQRHLVVVATSDRGLAGGFNSSIVRAARERIDAPARRGQGREDHHRRPQGARPAAPRSTASA